MYAIYAKPVGYRRFQPVDLKYGSLVDRLLYASIFFDHEKSEAERILEYLKTCNEGTEFQLRRISTKVKAETMSEYYRSRV